MSLMSDSQIMPLIELGMIDPFIPNQVRSVDGLPVISYGLSSCGYDIRLSPNQCFIIRGMIDPKVTENNTKKELALITDATGTFYVIPPLSYVLGVTVESFKMPHNVCGTATGKSTYARSGLVVNVTPLEPGWAGYLTLEMFNANSEALKVYADEGIAQIQFQRVEGCAVPYNTRGGKYMNQENLPVMAKL